MSNQQEIEAAKERWKENDYAGQNRQHAKDVDAMTLANAFCQQQSQPVNERLLNAAKSAFDEWHIPDASCSCHISPPCSDCVEFSFQRELHQELKAEIAAAEAEITEREPPIDYDWLIQQPGWSNVFPSLVPTARNDQLRLQCVFWPKTGANLAIVGIREIYDPTRGDVLDLMRVLGGVT